MQEEHDEESFSHYQEIANEIQGDFKSKPIIDSKSDHGNKIIPQNRNKSKNSRTKPGNSDDEYEFDFHEN